MSQPERARAPHEDHQDQSGAPLESGELSSKLAEFEQQLDEQKNKYLYLYSDFENFKRRAARERIELLRFGWEPLALELLEVIDNLERAIAQMRATEQPGGKEAGSSALISGIQLVLNQFRAVLQKQGIEPVESLHQMFDPNLHEVLAEEPSDLPRGTIVNEHLRGYRLHGRLLRPARVTVSSGSLAASAQGPGSASQKPQQNQQKDKQDSKKPS